MTEPNNRKGPGSAPGPNAVFSQNGASADSAFGSLGGVCSSCSLRSSLRTSSARIRPRCDLRSLRLLAFAVGLLVGRANERAFDEHMSALFDSRYNALCQERPEHNAKPGVLRRRSPPVIRGV